MSCLDMERENTENVIEMRAEVGKNGHSPYIDETTGTWFVFDDISRKYVDTNIKARGANSWEDIDGKPESFPPSEHNHDDRYYTEQEIDSQIQNLRNEIPSLTENIVGITVNGTELPVEDKKVALPIGSTTNFGLVKGASGHGINVLSGEMRINAATYANIDARTANKPINTINLNYAVKAALTDENRISGLTDLEKKNACNTIGSVYDGQYELIEEITLSEKVDSITRATDTQGNAYNFKAILIYAKFSANTDNSSIQVYVNGFGDMACNAQNIIGTSRKFAKIDISCNREVISANVIHSSSPAGTSYVVSEPYFFVGHSAITGVELVATKGIPSGSTIKIYGVRA